MQPIGVYLHIPFCAAKCPYCDFYSLPVDDAATGMGAEGPMDAYLAAAQRRLQAAGEAAGGLRADTVYFGGGTPSVFGAARLTALLEAVRRAGALEAGAEITAEVNPCSATPALLAALRAAGFNRLSIGVQSFCDPALRYLGRRHTAAQAEACIRAARAAGFDNLSVDLMLALPEAAGNDWRRSLEQIARLAPEHVSAYLLKLEPGTPFAGRQPAEEETAAQEYLDVCDALASIGLQQYEISNFARPGFASRHNLKYWRCEPYLGVGPGAHSFLDGRRFYFPRDLAAFIAGAPPVQDGEGGDATEYAMLALRLTEGLRESALRARYGLDFAAFFAGREAPLVRAGLLRRGEGTLAMTREGFLVSNAVLARLLPLDAR